MRPEKEIKNEIRLAGRREYYPSNSSDEEFPIKNSGRIEALEWVLEGEPRYSVAELEKISEALWKEFRQGGICEPTSKAFIFRLKDTKKVQEALKNA